ncbi:MAG: glycosyltransferase [Candidatus Cloacimonadia bacterium]
MTALLLVLLIFYVAFLLFVTLGTFQLYQPLQEEPEQFRYISVIVAARNEEENIASLIESLIQQDYPKDKYEIIVASDRSTDKTDAIVKAYSKENENIRYLRIRQLAEEKGMVGKKNALNKAIEQAQGEILLFTDADCLPGKNWLKEINRRFNRGFDVVVGYSPLLLPKKKFWQRLGYTLKELERLSIFTVSAGTIGWNWGVTATGRNFAYRKKVFNEVGGFEEIGRIPSGDDDLFLQKVGKARKYKLTFSLSADSFVPSIERKGLEAQYNQEKRRASKWRFYPPLIKTFSALIFLFYLGLFVAFILALFSLFPWSIFLAIFLIKVLVDFIVVWRGAVMFKEKELLAVFPLAELIYIPYFLFFAIMGTFTKYRWVGK